MSYVFGCNSERLNLNLAWDHTYFDGGLWCSFGCLSTHNLVPVCWQRSVTNYLASRKVREVGTCVCVCGLSATGAFNEPHASYQARRTANALIHPHGGWSSPHGPPHPPWSSHPSEPPLPFLLFRLPTATMWKVWIKELFILTNKERNRSRERRRNSTGQKRTRKKIGMERRESVKVENKDWTELLKDKVTLEDTSWISSFSPSCILPSLCSFLPLTIQIGISGLRVCSASRLWAFRHLSATNERVQFSGKSKTTLSDRQADRL